MPELPEIITIRNNLKREIINKKILDIIFLKNYALDASSTSLLKFAINSKIVDVSNIGKLLLLTLSSQYYIVIHLRMTGNLLWNKKDPYVRVSILLDGDNTLNFSTVRLFEYFGVWDHNKVTDYKKRIGKTPIESSLTLKEFISTFQSSASPIKTALLNQKKLAGLGNIYVNEALYLAKIHPNRPSNTLTNNDFKILLHKIKSTLYDGIKNRGSSINRYKDLYGNLGSQQDHFHIYGKKGQLCNQCMEKYIIYKKISGRGSYICPKCQI